MASLADVRGRLDAKRKQMHEFYEQAGPELDLSQVTVFDGDNDTKAARFRALNAEIDDLAQDEEKLAHVADIARANEREYKRINALADGLPFPHGEGRNGGAPSPSGDGLISFRKLLHNNDQFKAFRDGHAPSCTLEIPGVDLKTLVTLTTASPQNLRQPDVVQLALESRTVADLMLEGTIDRGIVEYYEETTFTNAATGVAEGSAKPESAEGFTLRTETARKIAHNIPATKESLDDNSFLESQLRGRLAFGVKRIEEANLLTGQGTGPVIQGLLNRTGIQTQARGTDPNIDAVYKAMQLVRGSAGSGFAEPTAVVVHPANWTTIKLARTADGIYLWGNPSDEGPDRIWGLPVRQTTAMTQNTILVGAFRPYAEVLRREGISVTMSTEHSTYFAENKVLLQAEERIALAVYRPSAFCQVTGAN